MKVRTHPLLFGTFGFLGMGMFYYVLLTAVTRDPFHPVVFFGEKWYLLAPLFLGFGAQMFLFQKLRIAVHVRNLGMVGASAGTSGVAMAACCAHHLADVFPLLGLLGAATIVTAYQDWFLAFGVMMNVVGAIVIWRHLKNLLGWSPVRSSACCSHVQASIHP